MLGSDAYPWCVCVFLLGLQSSTADVSEEERVLRQFDLDPRFGPCAGMTRLER